ncbi:hypothetical protein Pmani_037854 [Petrolisthes manimaculis]|uniref:Uncharacterized protein n=1 Tax=Petrolisthes manimaculis TaxID=1843537 RepID=A0AAE1NHI0_9EUCA|nr:hypothetical protein Pmani_037854 [Petrolisthes manimaculis]
MGTLCYFPAKRQQGHSDTETTRSKLDYDLLFIHPINAFTSLSSTRYIQTQKSTKSKEFVPPSTTPGLEDVVAEVEV